MAIQVLLKQDNGYRLSWQPLSEDDFKGFRVYGKTSSSDWQMLLDYDALPADNTDALIQVAQPDSQWFFMVKAVGHGRERL